MNKLKDQIKKAFKSVGLCYKDVMNYPTSLEAELYQLKEDDEKIRAHMDFLISLDEKEEKRLNSIESKTSQLIAQTGIIFSLLGLFIPIIMDKATAFNPWIKVLLLALLLFSFFFYLLTIHNSLKNYRINRFKYSRPSASNVLDFMDKKVEEFHAEHVRDLLNGVKKNAYINDRKGTNLLHSYKAFKIANLMTGILVGLFSLSILFLSKEKDTVSIDGPIEIKKIDSIINGLNKIDTQLRKNTPKDTIIFKNLLERH